MESENRYEGGVNMEDNAEKARQNNCTTGCRCSELPHETWQVESEQVSEQDESLVAAYQDVSYRESSIGEPWQWAHSQTEVGQFREPDISAHIATQLVERADEVISSRQQRRLSHRSMLGETLERATGTNPLKVNGQPGFLSPASVFEAFAYNNKPAVRQHFDQFFEIVALPRSPLTETRPGDILHVESEIVEIKLSRSEPDQGIVTVRGEMLNEKGEIVYRLTAKLLVSKRLIA